MREIFITYRSVTKAQLAQRNVRRLGLHCTMLRTPKQMQTEGCGYSLRMREPDFRQALHVLADYRAVYARMPDGRIEVMTP